MAPEEKRLLFRYATELMRLTVPREPWMRGYAEQIWLDMLLDAGVEFDDACNLIVERVDPEEAIRRRMARKKSGYRARGSFEALPPAKESP